MEIEINTKFRKLKNNKNLFNHSTIPKSNKLREIDGLVSPKQKNSNKTQKNKRNTEKMINRLSKMQNHMKTMVL